MRKNRPSSFSTLRRSALSVALVAALTPFVAHAAPTVEGMTIVMPQDGWYQVQSRSDYTEVCAGVYSCEVPAGSYNVINHSTGERFKISVDDSDVASSEIDVSGNVISWTQEGWHQVQNADTYESVCEGGLNCTVEPGRYKVINHSTGETWSDITVSADLDREDVEDEEGAPAVGNLSFERYSSSAVELFWSHLPSYDSDDGYTIYQDGRSIGRTNGTSYFLRDLPDGSSYQLDVRQAAQLTGSVITVPADGDELDPPIDIEEPETALELASRIDVSRYEEMITNVTAVTNDAEYTADNYANAISAVAVASDSSVIFDRYNFLTLLERQVIDNAASLGFTEVDEMDSTIITDRYNREHSCPDGGSYLAFKNESSDTPGVVISGSRLESDLRGLYSFSNCTIGEIVVDGFYEAQLPIRDTGIDALLYISGMRVTGVDGATTQMSASFQHYMSVTNEGTIDATYEGRNLPFESVTTVTVPSGENVRIELSSYSSESALLNGAAVTGAIPADSFSYDVDFSYAYISTGSTTGEIWANGDLQIQPSGIQESEQLVHNYSSGEVDFLMSPRTNSMRLVVDNGDPAGFNTFISSSVGEFSDTEEYSVVSFVDSWASGDFVFWTPGERFLAIWPAAE